MNQGMRPSKFSASKPLRRDGVHVDDELTCANLIASMTTTLSIRRMQCSMSHKEK